MTAFLKLWTLASLMLVTTASCSNDDDVNVGEDEVVQMLASATPIQLNEAQQQMRNMSNEFAWQLFRTTQQSNDNQGSSILSPMSVTYLLGMMDAGAGGSTRDEITSVLGFGNDVTAVNEFCKTMIDGAGSADPVATVKIANCVEVNSALGISLLQQYGREDLAKRFAQQLRALHTGTNYAAHKPCTMVDKPVEELKHIEVLLNKRI